MGKKSGRVPGNGRLPELHEVRRITPWNGRGGCNVHHCDTADCDCPQLDEWEGAGMNPYEEQNADRVGNFLAESWHLPW
jgi:hypothetical protein